MSIPEREEFQFDERIELAIRSFLAELVALEERVVAERRLRLMLAMAENRGFHKCTLLFNKKFREVMGDA